MIEPESGKPPLQADLLDNTVESTTHATWVKAWVKETDDGYPLAVATGFINIGGLDVLATAVQDGRSVRILVGAEPPQGLEGAPIADIFDAQRRLLGAERDFSRFPPNRAAERLVRIDNWLAGEQIQVRRYTRQFLHGKAYMFGSQDRTRVHAVTSANLTQAGLNSNLELGAVRQDAGPTSEAIAWFDRLWDESIDYKAELRELLFPDIGLVEPNDIYLRALAEYIGDLKDPYQGRHEIFNHLVDFQKSGYRRAREILDRHGGVIYADGVGTGKTEIGLSLVEHYCYDEGNYSLIVAPAQLVDNWRKRVQEAKLPAQVVSFSDLINDEQLTDDGSGKRVLSVNKNAYRLIVVDEAHALRNPDTRWHKAVARLAGGGEKHLALLTATPINNSLEDLLHLVMLFARHDRAFAAYGIPSLSELFKQADGDPHDPESINPDHLFPLVELTVVRRDRRFIEKHYPDAHFPDGTPVRFPKPLLSTPRYSLDEAHAGIVRTVASGIDSLRLARYTPSAYLIEPDARLAQVENQLAGLLRSGVLKRFESCWHSALVTIERMIDAHDVFLKLWDESDVALFGQALVDAAKSESDQASLAAVIEQRLDDDDGRAFRKEELRPQYRDAVVADRDSLASIRDELKQVTPQDDVKLKLLKDLIENSPAEKIAVFSTFADTIKYLEGQLPEEFAGRERIVVLGSDSTPDERTRALARFAPKSVVGQDYEPAEGEVDLMLATDVLSEGQNLQQADCVISYDMPWNPQRVVQRNGRVIRLLSPHDKVRLVTMLPEQGDLEQLLALEARIRTKVRAALAVGMESEVISDSDEPTAEESEIFGELKFFADGLETELGGSVKDDPYSGAFLGEEMRAIFELAKLAGDIDRLTTMPWGVGAVARVAQGGRRRPPGIFFATRTKPLTDGATEPREFLYWRYVELDGQGAFSDEPVADDERLEMLRRINSDDLESSSYELAAEQVDAAWQIAASDIVRVHNAILAGQALGISVGPAQRWARDLIKRGTTPESQTDAAAEAYEALAVERSTSVRRALKGLRTKHEASEIGDGEAVRGVLEVCAQYGLQKVENLRAGEVPLPIEEDDLAVVCWMAIGIGA